MKYCGGYSRVYKYHINTYRIDTKRNKKNKKKKPTKCVFQSNRQLVIAIFIQ